MTVVRRLLVRVRALTAALLMVAASTASPQPVRLGELNSYRAQPSFLQPYRNGWKLALEELNAQGGLLGRPVEVISRDDGGNPGDAVRTAQALISQEGAALIFGTFLSNVGLAVADFALQQRVLFLAAEPLTDKITWQHGNRYTFRLAPSTYLQVAMLVPEAVRLNKRRWALVYPNYEYGQSAVESFERLLKQAQPNVEIVARLAPPLGRVDGGAVAQAVADAAPDAIFNVLFGADLARFVREGSTRGLFQDRAVVSLLTGWPEYLDPLRDEAPQDWIVTGYPWYDISSASHQQFVRAYQDRWKDDPRQGSLIGYVAMQSIAAAVRRAGSLDTERLIAAFHGLTLESPLGPIEYRAIDHQATLGSFVGRTRLRDGRGVMVDVRYIDGRAVMPPDAAIRRWRPQQ